MKISEVVNVGFILVDIVSYDVFLVVELIREIKQFIIKSVVYFYIRKYVFVIEVVREGIIDEYNGIYYDFRIGEKFIIIDVIERKLIEVELIFVIFSVDGSGNKIIIIKLIILMVLWVVDFRLGEIILILKVIEEGIID